MKSIINGKRYDTETATELASWNNGCSSADFAYCHESLHRTTKGALFLFGAGGALSQYAEAREGGRSRCGGSRIIPMTEEQAVAWLEEHDKADEIEQHFASHVQDA